jgi:hypothetical protein
VIGEHREVPYATDYLLTHILSEDYYDRTGNGPTPDDFGAWTKFDYRQKWDLPQLRSLPVLIAIAQIGINGGPRTMGYFIICHKILIERADLGYLFFGDERGLLPENYRDIHPYCFFYNQ